jgi:hypothetical protein
MRYEVNDFPVSSASVTKGQATSKPASAAAEWISFDTIQKEVTRFVAGEPSSEELEMWLKGIAGHLTALQSIRSAEIEQIRSVSCRGSARSRRASAPMLDSISRVAHRPDLRMFSERAGLLKRKAGTQPQNH